MREFKIEQIKTRNNNVMFEYDKSTSDELIFPRGQLDISGNPIFTTYLKLLSVTKLAQNIIFYDKLKYGKNPNELVEFKKYEIYIKNVNLKLFVRFLHIR